MPITQQEKEKMHEVLGRTGGNREVMLTQRNIPNEYANYQNLCTQKEMTLAFPTLAPVRVIVTTPHNKKENSLLHVNFHGGGFIFLQNEDDDMYCAHLAVATGGVVVDVDYASSLNNPYPMALDQCYEVTRWAYEHCEEWGCDAQKLSVGGASAGGNLALVIALKAKETGDFPLCMQVLDFAATNNYKAIEEPVNERGEVFSLLYVDGDKELLKHPYVSPYYASDEQLAGLPKTLIVAPENCDFYEVNNELALRMEKAGVDVSVEKFANCRHGFTVRMCDDWQAAQEVIIKALNGVN